jgi:hypothetical protein
MVLNRDSGNETTHNYGEKLVNKTINLALQSIIDVQNLVEKNIRKLNAIEE